jgi:hypothetical protein
MSKGFTAFVVAPDSGILEPIFVQQPEHPGVAH